ncbi:MAG: EamA family transporter [Nocardioides sp.]
MLAIVLALGTSLTYGVANFLAPVLMRRHAVAAVLLTGQLAALAGSLLLLAFSGESTPEVGAVGLAVLAGVGNAAGLGFFYEAVRYGPLSVATPVGATAAALPVVAGVAGGDTLRALQVIGIVLAIGGAVLAARRESTEADHDDWDLRRCVLFAAFSAFGLGLLLTALPGAAADGELFWALTIQRSTIVVCFLGLILLRGQSFAHPSELRPPTLPSRLALLTPGLLLLSGTLMYILASERGQLSVVAVCGSLFPLVTVGLAIVVLREHVARVQAIGVAAAVLGVVLIAL